MPAACVRYILEDIYQKLYPYLAVRSRGLLSSLPPPLCLPPRAPSLAASFAPAVLLRDKLKHRDVRNILRTGVLYVVSGGGDATTVSSRRRTYFMRRSQQIIVSPVKACWHFLISKAHHPVEITSAAHMRLDIFPRGSEPADETGCSRRRRRRWTTARRTEDCAVQRVASVRQLSIRPSISLSLSLVAYSTPDASR